MPPTFNDRWLPWPRLSGGPVSRYSFRVGPAAARIQVWPLAPARWLWSAISSLTPIRLLWRLADLQSPSVARAVSPPGGTRTVSPRVAHGPSVPGWHTGRQSPSGARAVSSRVAHGPSGTPSGSRAVSSRVAHGPSDPTGVRAIRQSPGGARAVKPGPSGSRAVSPRGAHFSSVPPPPPKLAGRLSPGGARAASSSLAYGPAVALGLTRLRSKPITRRRPC